MDAVKTVKIIPRISSFLPSSHLVIPKGLLQILVRLLGIHFTNEISAEGAVGLELAQVLEEKFERPAAAVAD